MDLFRWTKRLYINNIPVNKCMSEFCANTFINKHIGKKHLSRLPMLDETTNVYVNIS